MPTVGRQGVGVPHPGLAERAFVLMPLADIADGVKHPVTGQSIEALVKSADATGVEKRLDGGWET